MSIDKYLNLITSQYRDKPKFIAWLSTSLQMLQDAQDLLNLMHTFFDIDTGEGEQLDILGVKIGVSRRVNFQPTDGSSPILSDDNYRLILKAKAAKNQWKGAVFDLYSTWDDLFPANPIIIKDNQNMTVDVIAVGFDSQIQKDLVNNGYIVPKTQAVGINYYFATTPIFGFDLENDTYKGFDEGNWLTTS